MLVDDLIQNHLQVLVGVIPLLPDILDLGPNADHFVVFLPHIRELALETVLEDIWWKEELREIEWLLLIVKIDSNLVVVVLLTHGQLVILLQENLTLPLKLLEVVEEGLVDLLNTVNDDADEDIVRRNAIIYQAVNIICDAHEGPFQHLLVLTVHTHTDSQLHSLGLLQQRDVVILMGLAHLLHGRTPRDFSHGC